MAIPLSLAPGFVCPKQPTKVVSNGANGAFSTPSPFGTVICVTKDSKFMVTHYKEGPCPI